MIERYTLPEMGNIWSLQNEWQTILNVELAACDAMAELGEIPAKAAQNIRAKASFNIERISKLVIVQHLIVGYQILLLLVCISDYL